MTPRQAARQYLPDLDLDWPEWQSRFAARLEYLTTPAGTWGAQPCRDWPTVNSLNLEPVPALIRAAGQAPAGKILSHQFAGKLARKTTQSREG